MAIDVRELQTRPLDPIIADELDIFERTVAEYLDGRVDEDVFRVFRLNHGVYGQRQGGHNQMLRVKIPHGTAHARAARDVRATSPRRTRAAGATSRPARTCSSTSSSSSRRPRSCGCSRRSASRRARRAATPSATSWAATSPARARRRCSTSRRGPRRPTDFLLRHPYAQRLPRKFKINFSGCATDCGQAMFNDVGVVADHPHARRRHERSRLQGVRRRRPRRQPAPRAGARRVHLPRRPAADDRGVPAHVRPLRQPRQQDPRPHEVARRHDGHRRAARAHLQGAQVPARRRATGRAASPSRCRSTATRPPARHDRQRDGTIVTGWAMPRSSCSKTRPVRAVGRGQRRARRRPTARSA